MRKTVFMYLFFFFFARVEFKLSMLGLWVNVMKISGYFWRTPQNMKKNPSEETLDDKNELNAQHFARETSFTEKKNWHCDNFIWFFMLF